MRLDSVTAGIIESQVTDFLQKVFAELASGR